MLSEALSAFAAEPSAGQRRAITLNLVIFFVFALTAVWFLTRTAVAANAINRDVASAIEPALGGINKSTGQLAALDKTGHLTRQIAAATKPLSGDLAGVVGATGRIKTNLASTGQNVTSIGASVEGIKRSTGVILPDINVLGGSVATIHTDARSIAGSLGSVAGLTTSAVANLNGAEASLNSVLASAGSVRQAVQSIGGTVPLINAHSQSIENSPILLRSVPQLNTLLGNLLGGL